MGKFSRRYDTIIQKDLRLSLKKLKKLLIMLHYAWKFLSGKDNMALCSNLRVTFFFLAGIFCLFPLFFDLCRRKGKRFALDIFVCFIQMPLWFILGVAILGIFPGLIYSYFSGIWLSVGLLLWLVPHGILAVKAFHRKDWGNVLCAVSVMLAIIFFCLSIHFWDMTKN